MTPLEIISTIFAVLVLAKIVLALINPKELFKLAEGLLHHYALATFTYLILVLLVGYYVFQELTIMQVAPVMLLTSLLIGMGAMAYHADLLKFYKSVARNREHILHRAWLNVLIWVTIAVWVLWALMA